MELLKAQQLQPMWTSLTRQQLPVVLIGVGFSVYVSSLPTTRCVIVNERLQTTIKASGKRCTELSSEEEAVVLTYDGSDGVGEGI